MQNTARYRHKVNLNEVLFVDGASIIKVSSHLYVMSPLQPAKPDVKKNMHTCQVKK